MFIKPPTILKLYAILSSDAILLMKPQPPKVPWTKSHQWAPSAWPGGPPIVRPPFWSALPCRSPSAKWSGTGWDPNEGRVPVAVGPPWKAATSKRGWWNLMGLNQTSIRFYLPVLDHSSSSCWLAGLMKHHGYIRVVSISFGPLFIIFIALDGRSSCS